MKCPLCNNYFEAGVTQFKKIRISYQNVTHWKPDDYIKVCPNCYNAYNGEIKK